MTADASQRSQHPISSTMPYDLRLTTTASGIGFFSCCPPDTAFFSDMLGYLQDHPFDDFMHKHLLELLGFLDENKVEAYILKAHENQPVLRALLLEACLAYGKFFPLLRHFPGTQWAVLAEHTPLINLRSHLLADHSEHARWSSLLDANISEHQSITELQTAAVPLLYEPDDLKSLLASPVHVREISETKDVVQETLPSLEDTTARALSALERIGVVASMEMRHGGSLSPYALFRQWKLELAVRNGRHDYTLSGIQTSYGKGLSLETAKASYAMEMVERVSSFASIGSQEIIGYGRDRHILRGTYRELLQEGYDALDPCKLALEAGYQGQPLHWMECEEKLEDARRSIWVPVQCIFLFCNLDEVSLFSGLGSTGLASGNTRKQARVSGLLEVLERDAEATTPFSISRCFQLEARDPILLPLLEDYRARNIHVCFQDITTAYGIPCYKCYVTTQEGSIVKGTGAHLNARKAIVSALTEVPYPYPYGPPSRPNPEGLPMVRAEDLADYSTGSPSGDLALLERILLRNGHRLIYADLTRDNLGIPVARAIVPGLEFMADFDRFSRISPRLFANVLQVLAEGKQAGG